MVAHDAHHSSFLIPCDGPYLVSRGTLSAEALDTWGGKNWLFLTEIAIYDRKQYEIGSCLVHNVNRIRRWRIDTYRSR